jgi:hypothetical protein
MFVLPPGLSWQALVLDLEQTKAKSGIAVQQAFIVSFLEQVKNRCHYQSV